MHQIHCLVWVCLPHARPTMPSILLVCFIFSSFYLLSLLILCSLLFLSVVIPSLPPSYPPVSFLPSLFRPIHCTSSLSSTPPVLLSIPDEVLEDPMAPKPVGPTMQPAVGVPLESRQEWHRNLEAAIQHHSTTLAKFPAISIVDPHGKVSVVSTYSELWSQILSAVWTLVCGRCAHMHMYNIHVHVPCRYCTSSISCTHTHVRAHTHL